MTTLSIEDLIRNGSFGSIQLRSLRCDIEQQLGAPSIWSSETKNYRTAAIWKYANIEFCFRNDILTMLFVDDFSTETCEHVKADFWFLNNGLTCQQAEYFLSKEGIEFYRQVHDTERIQLTCASGAILSFDNIENASTLRSIVHKLD